MISSISNQLAEEFSSLVHEHGKVMYWSKPYTKFEIHVFSAVYKDSATLERHWEFVNDEIAVRFQTKLEKDIESWNIYLIFLIEGVVSRELKYKVEQDKFSSRKLVFDNFSGGQWNDFLKDDQSIIKYTSKKLFDINLYQRTSTEEATLLEILEKDHSNLLSAIAGNINKVQFKPILDIFLKSL